MKVKKEVAFAEEVAAAEAAPAEAGSAPLERQQSSGTLEKKEDGAGNTGTAKRKSKKKKGEEVMGHLVGTKVFKVMSFHERADNICNLRA